MPSEESAREVRARVCEPREREHEQDQARGQALRVLVMAEAAKWTVSLVGLVSLLSGRAGVEAANAAPGAVVIGFCVAWAAPLLALVKRN